MELPLDVIKLDHVAIATWDVCDQVRMLTEILGAEFFDGADEQDAGFRWLQFTFPQGGKIEVLEPLHRDGFLYAFLTKRGEGLHHITVYVTDLATAITQVRSAGYEPIDINLGSEYWKEAFIRPKDNNGVLLQLAQTPFTDQPNPALKPLEEYLADRPNLRPET